MDCRQKTFSFEYNYSLFFYEGVVQDAVLAYKSQGHRRLGLLFAELLFPILVTRYPTLPIVPVPPRPERLKRMGFDPIGTICGHLARMGSIRVLPLLKRKKGTRAQKLLNKKQREENLKEAFQWVGPEKGERELPEVVLLDDVFTTGATLSRCAEVLKGVGIGKVFGLTIAHD